MKSTLSRLKYQVFIMVIIVLNLFFMAFASDRLRFDLVSFTIFLGTSILIIYLKMSRKQDSDSVGTNRSFDFLLIFNFVIYIALYIGVHYVGIDCQDLSKKYRCACYSIMTAEFNDVSGSKISTKLNEKYCPDWEAKP